MLPLDRNAINRVKDDYNVQSDSFYYTLNKFRNGFMEGNDARERIQWNGSIFIEIINDLLERGVPTKKNEGFIEQIKENLRFEYYPESGFAERQSGETVILDMGKWTPFRLKEDYDNFNVKIIAFQEAIDWIEELIKLADAELKSRRKKKPAGESGTSRTRTPFPATLKDYMRAINASLLEKVGIDSSVLPDYNFADAFEDRVPVSRVVKQMLADEGYYD